jgi:hypothetical protein
VARPCPKYLLNCQIADPTGQLWVTLYSDNAQLVMGRPVTEILPLDEEGLHELVKERKYMEWVFHVTTSRTQSMVRRVELVD